MIFLYITIAFLAYQLYKSRNKYSYSLGPFYISREKEFRRRDLKAPICRFDVVTLVGVCHIGNKSFYDSVDSDHFDKFALVEGVADDDGLLDDWDYSGLARLLGLVQQPKFTMQQEPADLDVNTLPSKTIEILNIFGKLLQKLIKMEFNEKEWDTLAEKLKGAKIQDLGLLEGRNTHLIEKIKESIPEQSNILVPWGAAHLPEIEEFLLKEGFAHYYTKNRVILTYPGCMIGLIKFIWNYKP